MNTMLRWLRRRRTERDRADAVEASAFCPHNYMLGCRCGCPSD